jgi:hypothetical protein
MNRPTIITFRQFTELARRRNLSPQSLAERFRKRIENPLEFFTRVLSGKSPDSVIPYRSVLEFYATASSATETKLTRPVCACGCGAPVFDRKKWAKPGCRKKSQRENVRNRQMWLGQLVEFVKPRLGQNCRKAVLPLTGSEKCEFEPIKRRRSAAVNA